MGIVEGLTEFAPVSSTGHMILTGHLLGFEGARAETFEVVIQLGSIMAVLFVFWQRILNILGLGNKEADETDEADEQGRLSIWHLAIGMAPFVILGALFHSYIKGLFSASSVVIGLIAGGVLMIIAEGFRKPRPVAKTLDDVTYKQALLVGLFQCFALWPGFSRSGSTISGGLLVGLSHRAASEFTFIMAVPIMMAATAKDLYESWGFLTLADLPLFITGFITAFVVAMVAIKYFLQLISKVKLVPFAIYRFVLAIVFWFFIL
ncbi:undecaprenyl-diphosphate phosphatase [Hazenella coriacea]